VSDVLSAEDYYPFGLSMPGRKLNDYRYGFNGKEDDSETGWQDYGMRIYKPGLGKFLSVDPMTNKYAKLTPYQFASNRPSMMIDIDGLEGSMGISGSALVAQPRYSLVEFDSDGDYKPDYSKGWATGALFTFGSGVVILGGARLLPIFRHALIGGAGWVSKPENQQKIADVVNVTAELFNPDPTPLNPGSPGGELARLLKSLPRALLVTTGVKTASPLAIALGKVKSGLGDFSKKYDMIDYNNWEKFFKFTDEVLVSWPEGFRQALNKTIEGGGKIVFRLDGVDIEAAKKGFIDFTEAKRAVNENGTLGKITEWELSQIIRNDNWFQNTVFMRGDQVVDPATEKIGSLGKY
jgi:RHS repeat-associated protein